MGHAICQTSLAHTYGNVASFIMEYVKGLFPNDYFNTVHISTAIAYRQMAKDKFMTREFSKKRKPMLIIRPRIELYDNDSFLYDTLLTTRYTDNFSDTGFTNFQDFLTDDYNGMELRFLLNRLVMNFEISIIHETLMQHIDTSHFLKNRLVFDKAFMLSTALESNIPKQLLEMISKDMKVSMYDDKGSPKKFLDYMNSVSIYPISYKMKNSTGNDEFFRFYPANIMTTLSNLSMDDGSKRGMVADSHQITFNIRTEFDGAGLYYYYSKSIKDLDMILGDIRVKYEEGQHLIPLFTINNLYSSRIAENWNIFATSIFQVEILDKNTKEDNLDVSTLFSTSNLPTIFKFCKENGMPINTFFIPMVMKNNIQLEEYKGFELDYNALNLKVYDLDESATYRLIFHLNPMVVNDTIADMNNFGKEY